MTELPTEQMRQDMFTPWRHDRGQQPWLPHPDFHPLADRDIEAELIALTGNNLIDAELNLLEAWERCPPPWIPQPKPAAGKTNLTLVWDATR